ncbi:MAG: AmmeMemoRadiSam system protein B [Deltaproteobacteria bacterium]|nr:AmmeMemoRadiSam system protein B [Deltaproteobacteria bacterium]
MDETNPCTRKDLEFFPVQQGGQEFVLIRDHLGLVKEGKAVALPLYHIMTLLDGARTARDIQTEFMRQRGGVLVESEEVERLLDHLDASYLLDSQRFRKARDKIISDFTSRSIRACSHCGNAYPEDPSQLKERLDDILANQPSQLKPEGKMKALVAPHIDLSAGYKAYSKAYQMLKYVTPSRIVILGVGHHVMTHLFCLTDKAFETPLGTVKNDAASVRELRDAGGDAVTANDFAHRSEHSIEFQLLFLHHLLKEGSFHMIPILCGSVETCLYEYTRKAYQEKAGPFLKKLKELVTEPDHETLIIAGVDFSHIGPKFGHEMPALYMENQSEPHDRNLLDHLCRLDADAFWEESKKMEDRFNVCGFSALACLLEVLPSSKGDVLAYELWHEEATRSAVSFAAVVFS